MFEMLGRGFVARMAVFASAVGFSVLSTIAVSASFPDPAQDVPKASGKGSATAVFAGGCFWGVDAVFKHVKGVTSVKSGYAGGAANTAQYETVSSGTTGHAEAVEVIYDPSQVTYGQLLRVFFAVAHNPTQLNRQGPDVGTQYRSAIFYTDADQQRIAKAYIDQLQAAKQYPQPIVTEITSLKAFYPAEAYHQNYLALHPNSPYIVFHDMPKLASLKQDLPALYVAR